MGKTMSSCPITMSITYILLFAAAAIYCLALQSPGAIAVGYDGSAASPPHRLPRWLASESAAVAEPAPAASSRQRPVFMEYIGGGGAALADVPMVADAAGAVDFYFILAFATDASTTDGNFQATWQPRLSPTNIAAIKSAHPTARVSASIGGGNPNAVFGFISLDTWIANAVASLSAIISLYHIDAIDIDFESFGSHTSAEDFATCIGELITQLKHKGLVSVATIAPYPGTDYFYGKLWESYNNTIDYVNYQFYSEGDMTVSQYVDMYERAKSRYAGGTVMASFETVNNGTNIVPASGFDACQTLAEEGELHGIFIWSADQSYSNFQFERKAQSLLQSLAAS